MKPPPGPVQGADRRLSRRDLLRIGPGAAAALALGCGMQPSSRGERALAGRITGSIVGASHRVGHRLRDGRFPEPQQVREVPVVIVGAGIAGLSAGWKLAASGFRDFVVLELETEPGGNARWGANAISAFPWGAHYLPTPTAESTAVHELVDEMGLVRDYGPDGGPIYDPRHLCHAPQERVFIGGVWREGLSARDIVGTDSADGADGAGDQEALAGFEAQVRRYRAFRDARGRRAFAVPVAAGTADPDILALDRISMREYFDRAGWASPRLRWYVDYCCRDDYGCTIDTTSAWAGWHYFCSRPAGVEYLTWPEGNGRIVRHFLDRMDGQVRTGMLVYRVRPAGDALFGASPRGPDGDSTRGETGSAGDGGVDVDVLDTRDETTVRYRARRCIYALPRFTAPRVIDGYSPAGIEAFTYSPWMVANLTVDRLPEGAAWDNVLYDSPSLGYVVATHQNLRMTTGRSVLTYYLPLTVPNPEVARAWMLEQEWRDWVSLVLADLGQAHPGIESTVTHADVMLWGHAMIRPQPDFVWGAARRMASAPYGPVRFAHSDMSGISLFEEAQYHGVRAAEATMRELGHPFSSSL